jgi:hypothetical protein
VTQIFTSVKSTPTTVPNDTHIEVLHALGDGVLVYRPDENAFVALYPDEWLEVRAEGHRNMTAIEELQAANRDVTEKSLQLQALRRQPNAAKADLTVAENLLTQALDTLAKKSEAAKTCIEPIANQATDANKMVELVPLTMKRLTRTTVPVYVSARHLRRAMRDRRVYLVDGPAERQRPPAQKLFNGTSLNRGELKKRIANHVQDQSRFEKKWKLAPDDGDQFGGILTDWAKVMGASATGFLERTQQQVAEGVLGADKLRPDDPERNIDLKPEAQFMRWSAGAGAAAVFRPFQGALHDPRDHTWQQKLKRAGKSAQFSVKANAEASFAVGEAKIETAVYVPHAAGWHLAPGILDLGYFRLRADLKLYAMAGASVALEADVALMVNGDRQGLVGRPARRGVATAKVGAKGEAQVFAGLKEGIDLKGAVQWLNPEGFVDMKSPKKVDPGKAIAEYVDVASVSCGASLIQGLAVTLGFQCDYRRGKFVIAAKAGACLGMGGSGSVAGEVSYEHIGQFFMCIAHQLKQIGYKKVPELIGSIAFEVFNKIFFMAFSQGKDLGKFVGMQILDIEKEYSEALQNIRQKKENFIMELYKQMRTGWGMYSYLPPESRGAVIANIAAIVNEPNNLYDINLREKAAFVTNELLSTTQSLGHLHNTLDRVNITMGSENSRNQGIELVNSVVENTVFANCLNRCETELAMVIPLLGRPFLRNDKPELYLAKFPLHHPGFQHA